MSLSIYEWCIILITMYAAITYFISSETLSKKIFICLTTSHLLIVQGLRSSDIGVDLGRYSRHFLSTQNSSYEGVFSNIFNFEFGYNLFTTAASNLNLSFQVFIFLISLINLTVLGWMIYQYSSNAYISYMMYIILGLYDFGFSGLRQSLALSIILISYHFINKKKLLFFLISIIIASLFHSTALIFGIVCFLQNEKIVELFHRFYVFVLLIVILLGNRISLYITSIFNEEYIGYGAPGDILGTTAIIIATVLIIGYYTQLKTPISKDTKISTDFFNILLIALIVQLFSSYSYLFTRLNFFFYQFIIFYIPIVYDKFIYIVLKRNRFGNFLIRYFISIFLFIILLLYFHSYLQQNPHGIMPHSFYWE